MHVSTLAVLAEGSYNAFVTRLSAKLYGAKCLVTDIVSQRPKFHPG
jgi:hypothetical protein